MNNYLFVARTNAGKKIKTHIKCESEEDLKRILIDHNCQLIKYRLIKERKPLFTFDVINDKDVLSLCEKLKMMVKAGISLSDAFYLSAETFIKPKLKNTLIEISKDINKGKPLSAVFKSYEKVLPNFFITMMSLADVSGKTIDILEQLINYYSFEIKLKKKVSSSLFYPIILCILSVVVIIVISFVIVPSFVSIFEEMKVTLPPLTKFVIGFSNFLKKYLILIILVIFGIIIGLTAFFKTKKGKYLADKLKLRVPLIRTIPLINLTGRFCRSMKLLLDSGITVTNSLQLTANLIGNDYVLDRFNFAIDEIKRGESLSNSLYTLNMFPNLFIETLSVSEKTSSLSYSLKNLSEIYEDDAQNKLQKLTTIIEPVFIILMASIVLLIVIAIFVPLFSMLDSIR